MTAMPRKASSSGSRFESGEAAPSSGPGASCFFMEQSRYTH